MARDSLREVHSTSQLAEPSHSWGGSLPPVDVPERIEVDDGIALVLTWSDGGLTTVPAAELRAACECATCLSLGSASGQVADPAAVRILDATLVGAYAINFTFAPDHHSTGIYPFDRLRALGKAQ